MKVLTRTQFLALKGPVLYSKIYADQAGPETQMSVKYDTMGDDWVCQPLSGYDMQGDDSIIAIDVWSAVENGNYPKDLKVDMECAGRDGLFETEEECKFLVFDADDLNEFLRKITDCFKRAIKFAEEQKING